MMSVDQFMVAVALGGMALNCTMQAVLGVSAPPVKAHSPLMRVVLAVAALGWILALLDVWRTLEGK